MTALNEHMQTKCPFADCLAEFEIALSPSDPKVTRPVNGTCNRCLRKAGFKPLSIIHKLEKNIGKRSEKSDRQSPKLTVLVEDVRSLWNVGSIFRTADGAGFPNVILTGISGCPPRKEIAKVSLGAEDHLEWQYFLSAVEIIPRLKSEGVLMVGLERNSDSKDLQESLGVQALCVPLCLIVGNEVTGLSPESLDLCDLTCDLPMHGFKESLNVAVAFGIASYLISTAFRSTLELDRRADSITH